MAKAKTRKAPRQPWQGESMKAQTLRVWGINSRSTKTEVDAAVKRYNKEKEAFGKRVRNYNAATGSKYSASKMFLILQQHPESEYSKAMRGILDTSKAQPHTKGKAVVLSEDNLKAAETATKEIWGGAMNKSKTIAALWAEYELGNITIEQFNERAKEWGKIMNEAREARKNGDPTIGSDV